MNNPETKSSIREDSVTLTGPTVTLIPSKRWRELARSGVRSMHYRIEGQARTASGPVFIRGTVPATDADGDLVDLAPGFTVSHLAKWSPALDTAKLRYDGDGNPAKTGDGGPVYDEQPIVQDDGAEFPMSFGTLFLVTAAPRKCITLRDVRLVPTGGHVNNGEIPVYDAEFADIEVTERAAATGPKLSIRPGVTAGTKTERAARAKGAETPSQAQAFEC